MLILTVMRTEQGIYGARREDGGELVRYASVLKMSTIFAVTLYDKVRYFRFYDLTSFQTFSYENSMQADILPFFFLTDLHPILFSAGGGP